MASISAFRPFITRALGLTALAAACLIPWRALSAQQDTRILPYQDDQSVGDWSDQIPAHLAATDGVIQLERDGVSARAEENEPLLAGDRLTTTRSRAEVLFGDGSSLDIDQNSDVDLLSDSLVRVTSGRVRLLVTRAGAPAGYRIDAAGTTATFQSAGEYELTIADRGVDPEVRLMVIRGSAEFRSTAGAALLRAGTESRATSRRYPSTPYAAIITSSEAFDRWIDDQHDQRVSVRSAQYLPDDLRTYGGVFDRDGDWQYERGYGYVWYPRVAYDWQPYYDGRWTFVGSFGWTWVGAGAWTWPTHHYGRWGVSGSRWFWVPERRWAPAWVSWAGAPGYVSWCPLGYDNRPVFAVGGVYASNARRGWTVVPSGVFATSFSVRSHAVGGFASASNRFAPRGAPARPFGARAVAASTDRPDTRQEGRFAAPRANARPTSGQTSSSRVSRTRPDTSRGFDRSGSRVDRASLSRPVPENTPTPFSRTRQPSGERRETTPAPARTQQSERMWRARPVEPQLTTTPAAPAPPASRGVGRSRTGNGMDPSSRVSPPAAPPPQARQETPGVATRGPSSARPSSEGRRAPASAPQTERRAGRRQN